MDFGGVMFPTECAIQLEAMAAAGVSRALFDCPSKPRDAVLARLDSCAAVIR